jgi:hypothetical protein
LKERLYSADQNAINDRVRIFCLHLREQIAALKESEQRDIIIVTHGVFMKHLLRDPEIDLPKTE